MDLGRWSALRARLTPGATPAADPAVAPVAAGPPAPHTLGEYWVKGFLGTALVLLLGLVATLFVWADHDAASVQRQVAGAADALAAQVANSLRPVRKIAESWREDPDLQAVLGPGSDPAALARAERAVQERVPGALRVYLLTADQINAPNSPVAMSHAGLDLNWQAARTRALTPLEVHQVGKPDAHLALAGPVLDAAKTSALGVVQVFLPLSLLPAPVMPPGVEGLMLFQQTVGNGVADLGSTPAPAEPPDYVAEVPGSRLRCAVWITPPGLLAGDRLTPLLTIWSVLLVLSGAALWVAYRAQRAAVRADSETLAGLFRAATRGQLDPQTRPQLAELGPILQGAGGDLVENDGAPLTVGPARPPAAPDLEFDLAGLLTPTVAPAPPLTDAAAPPAGALGDAEDLTLDLDLSAGAPEVPAPAPPAPDPPDAAPEPIAAEIFRTNDIRGIVDGPLTASAMQAIGQAVGSEALARGDTEVMVGRDCRPSSPSLARALIAGIRASGANVVNLGVVPTPLLQFACRQPRATSGAMVTGAHNPADYNGVKVVFQGADAQTDEVSALRTRILEGQLAEGSGNSRSENVVQRYSQQVSGDVKLARGLRVVIDCGNATAAVVAPPLLRALGCEVVELNCDLNADQTDLLLDPSQPKNLKELGALVIGEGAELGLAFGSDGARLGVVDSQGCCVAADRILMLLAADMLARHPGAEVIYDVRCSRHLAGEVRRAGGEPVIWQAGQAALSARLREDKALIAGELTGHFFFKERWFGFDDAIYSGIRLLEVLARDPRPSSAVFAALPGGLATPELALPLAEGEPARIMERVLGLADQMVEMDLIRIDGLRAEFDRGFGLVRASQTQPRLTFRFEGDDAEALNRIKDLFRRLMEQAAPGLTLPF